MEPLPRNNPRLIMDMHNQRNIVNGVNGSRRTNLAAVTPGRDGYVRRVTPVRHHATVGDVRGRQADSHCNTATVRDPNREKKRIATWNVRSLIRDGKAENVAAEAERMNLDILGVSEVRWPGVSQITVGNYEFIYSGSEQHTGVGVMMKKEVAMCLEGYWAVSDRVILVKIRGNPFNTAIIQVYAPTGAHSDQEIEQFYADLDSAMKQVGSQDIRIVMGDLNAKIGQGREGEVVGPWGLGERNERGDRLYEWCQENEQVITNTWFRHHPRLLYTWKSPGDLYRNQIDYISINNRFRNSVKQVKAYPGADCGSDHSPVVATMILKLKKLTKGRVKPARDLKSLRKCMTIREEYVVCVRNRFAALIDESENDAEAQWSRLQEALNGAADEVIPNVERRRRQEWMNEDILQKMNRRRLMKNKTSDYKALDKEIKEDCSRARDRWLNEQCAEVERLEKIDSQVMHKKIKEMTGSARKKTGTTIKKKNGDIAVEKNEIKLRWMEYTQELYNDVRADYDLEVEGSYYQGSPILQSEVEAAMKAMKAGKAVGEDGIAVEMLEVLGEWGVEVVSEIANCIYDTGRIPDQMARSVFITIPKKPGAIDCDKFRTISIMSQLSKLVLRIVLNRAKNKIEAEIAEEQYGFRKGKGTCNAIFVLRMIIERAIEVQKNLFMCFIDYQKAFDTVKHEELLALLSSLDIGRKDLRIIRNLYYEQTAAVRVDNELTDYVKIKRGVRQGCVLSPVLFSLYSEIIMRKIADMEGISIGGQNVNNIRYADDTVLIADSQDKLQRMIEKVNAVGEELGLKINRSKTECMVTAKGDVPTCNITIRNEPIQQVSKFKYLGSTLTEDGRCESEIKQRIGVARSAFIKMRNVISNRHVRVATRIRLIKTYIWATLLYGCEAWTINKEMERRLEAFEMWCWRRMLRISWMERRTNDSILEELGKQREMIKTIRRRQLGFLGHALRREALENLSLTGRIPGTRARGRPRMKYMDGIKKVVPGGLGAGEILQMSRRRQEWKSMIANVFSDSAHR